MIGEGRPLLPEILDQSDRVGAKSPIFDLFARGDLAVTPSEQLQLTLIGSLSLSNEPTMNIVLCPLAPQSGAQNSVSEI